GKQVSLAELMFINISVTLVVLGLECWWLMKQETTKYVTYEKIENIRPENYHLLIADLEARTGLKIIRAEVGKIDFLRDVAQVKIYFMAHDQHEAYSSDFENN